MYCEQQASRQSWESNEIQEKEIMKTIVVHCKKAAFDIYIGRPSKFGNPFKIGRDGNRAQVIEKYRAWISSQSELLAEVKKLKGKRLGYWCKPQACHGDVLAEIADAE
jgi:Domain of unknown function (DUF4326)